MEKDELEDYKTNQVSIGMKELFRGFIIKVWKEVNFSSSKYHELNKILVNHTIKFYREC